MTEYYKAMLEKGLRYQDFITELLLQEIGISISTFSSEFYQKRKGENAQGVEIKFDDKYKKTGNLYIEISEKSNPNNPRYVNSGIYRNDNTWLWIQGNYESIYIFGKTILQLLHKASRYKQVEISTSKGFLMPRIDAQKYALKILNSNEAAPSIDTELYEEMHKAGMFEK